MASTATAVVLTAGTITFANEWYQTKELNWKIPLATILAALATDALSHISDNAALGLSILILIGAATTRFNGKSVADTLSETFSKQPAKKAG